MLYYLFDILGNSFDFPGENLFDFLSFRAAAAAILSLVISMVFGKAIIRKLLSLQVGETVRDLGLDGQKEKEGTPTMGGLLILASILIPTLLLAKLDNIYIILMIVSTIWMGAIGFADDYIKVFRKNKEGLKGRFKIVGQVGLGLIVGLTMYFHEDVYVKQEVSMEEAQRFPQEQISEMQDMEGDTHYMATIDAPITNIPFLKGNEFNYEKPFTFVSENCKPIGGVFFVIAVIFIITAVSNGANLTDGIDGLATGSSAIVGVTLFVFAYISGNIIFSNYLNVLFIPHVGELTIFIAAFVGACIGFLWHNSFPARVFMGDTGSLAIGGIIAALAIILRKELLLPVLCGIFLIENLSVMLQVAYFKYTRKKYGEGKRIFLMAPLHHHYQKKGMHESKIVTRFWIVGILLAIIAIATLKIR
ncbi:MAG: phospho-N-acetylmuramoyl-pentapeptide-transferase [Chitinophagales bacterium]